VHAIKYKLLYLTNANDMPLSCKLAEIKSGKQAEEEKEGSKEEKGKLGLLGGCAPL
jgi:hypothetical protein